MMDIDLGTEEMDFESVELGRDAFPGDFSFRSESMDSERARDSVRASSFTPKSIAG